MQCPASYCLIGCSSQMWRSLTLLTDKDDRQNFIAILAWEHAIFFTPDEYMFDEDHDIYSWFQCRNIKLLPGKLRHSAKRLLQMTNNKSELQRVTSLKLSDDFDAIEDVVLLIKSCPNLKSLALMPEIDIKKMHDLHQDIFNLLTDICVDYMQYPFVVDHCKRLTSLTIMSGDPESDDYQFSSVDETENVYDLPVQDDPELLMANNPHLKSLKYRSRCQHYPKVMFPSELAQYNLDHLEVCNERAFDFCLETFPDLTKVTIKPKVIDDTYVEEELPLFHCVYEKASGSLNMKFIYLGGCGSTDAAGNYGDFLVDFPDTVTNVNILISTMQMCFDIVSMLDGNKNITTLKCSATMYCNEYGKINSLDELFEEYNWDDMISHRENDLSIYFNSELVFTYKVATGKSKFHNKAKSSEPDGGSSEEEGSQDEGEDTLVEEEEGCSEKDEEEEEEERSLGDEGSLEKEGEGCDDQEEEEGGGWRL